MHAQARTQRSTPRTCHGRAPEITQILGCLERASHGEAGLVLVVGPHAIGKSTLMTEATRQLAEQGAILLHAHCAPGQRPYGPFLEIAHQIWELSCGGGDEALLSHAERLLEVLRGSAQMDQGSAPAVRRFQMFEEMAILLRSLGGKQPVVVVIHDLDFAGALTHQLLSFLGRTLAVTPGLEQTPQRFNGLIVASANKVPESVAELTETGALNLTTIRLGGLDAEGVRSFLMADEVVRQVLRLTEGDPGKLKRLVQGHTDDRAEPLGQKLEGAELTLLRTLAVFGRPLGAETLRLLTELPFTELGRSIASLIQKGILERRPLAGELRIGFVRAGDQRTIYDALDPDQRRELHTMVGAYLEQQGESELESCASHTLRGSVADPDAALRIALAAGLRLERSLCFERAADLYEQSLPLTTSDSVRLELSLRLCAVYQVTGQLEQALEHAERCRDLEPKSTATVVRIINLHLLRGDLTRARQELSRLGQPDGLGAEGSAEHAAEVLALSARAYYAAGERDLALAATEQGLSLCGPPENVPDTRIRLSLQNTRGKIVLEKGEHERARSLFLDNLERSRAAGLTEESVLALIQLGLIGLENGDLDRAERWYRQALEQASAIGEHRLRGACLQHLAVVAERRCRYDQALALYHEAVGVWKQAWLRSYLAWVAVDLGKLYLRLGDIGRAKAMVELSERMADSEPSVQTRINQTLLKARVARHEHQYGEAERLLTRAQGLASSSGHTEREQSVCLELAELALEQERPEQALSMLSDQPNEGYLQLRAHMLRGRTLLSLDRTADARRELGKAFELGDRLSHPETTWQASYLLSVIATKQERAVDVRRHLSCAENMEAKVRTHVPAEFHDSLAADPLRRALADAVQTRSSRSGKRRRPPRVERPTARVGEMVGSHPRMDQLFAHIERVARTNALVLVRGESGTGKELVADAIHHWSPRAEQPLVKVNCAALVESLLLSELFGHERGAFTGATERRKGRFEVADGGTIFLDEIGDISPATQVALLRVLQQQEFERVGGTKPIKVDVRIICATNRDLEQLVADGAFREDLYYRLKGFVIEVPPLRERTGDVPLLADHFLRHVSRERELAVPRRLTDDAMRLLSGYGWPGNVRELENVLRSVSLLSDSELLDVDDFSEYPELSEVSPGERCIESALTPYEQIRQHGVGLRELKKQIEYECILEALRDADGSISGAARLLGIKRPRLSQLVKEYGISVR